MGNPIWDGETLITGEAGAGDRDWRLAFVGGLLVGGLVWFAVDPGQFALTVDRSYGAVVAAGLLVGFGTRMGNGCTSGHGVCGLGRLSPRSLVAVITFLATGMITVYVMRHVM